VVRAARGTAPETAKRRRQRAREEMEAGPALARDMIAEAYATSRSYRREVIDRTLDGFIWREGCEDGEEACDFCREQSIKFALVAEARSEAEVEAGGRARARLADASVVGGGPGVADPWFWWLESRLIIKNITSVSWAFAAGLNMKTSNEENPILRCRLAFPCSASWKNR
jgi:hypothetical protein